MDPDNAPIPISYLVCLSCRAVSVESGVLVHEVGCREEEGVEEYPTRPEALARGVGLWFASLRLPARAAGPDRGEDGMKAIDYTDPYFREGR